PGRRGLVDAGFVLNLLGAIGGLGSLATIVGVAYWLGRKFAEIDKRFEMIEYRLNLVDERFKQVDKRFDEMKKYVDDKVEELKEYTDSRVSELKEYFEGRLGELEERFSSRIERLAEAFTSYQEFFVEFLTTEGVIKPGYRDLLIKHARGTMRLAALNPLTREEWERLKLYLDKSERDELTLEEADDFLELARKVVREYGEHPEAWKLHIYAAMTRALTAKRYYEQRGREEKREQSQQGA
ncbi:MAG: apolipoprotein A1/A4/E family protein, partial [Thermofilum sp.]|nr:apolipoprotein A1/A4/E family protein [Thermofilum sp.]